MNSYYLAILQATNNNEFPELDIVWRNYHPFSVLSDSDYPLMTDIQDVFLSE